MTANQINYAKLKEDQRSHRANESIQIRQARAAEIQADASQQQALTAANAQRETARHNLEGEAINWFAERSADALRAKQGEAQMRQAAAAETSAAASVTSANAAVMQARNQANLVAENIRHNLAAENEVRRSNLVSEQLKDRSTSVQSAYNVARIGEETRHNQASEDVAHGTLEESIRHNTTSEDVAGRDATSRRISSIASAVNAGSRAVSTVSQLARDITGALGSNPSGSVSITHYMDDPTLPF